MKRVVHATASIDIRNEISDRLNALGYNIDTIRVVPGRYIDVRVFNDSLEAVLAIQPVDDDIRLRIGSFSKRGGGFYSLDDALLQLKQCFNELDTFEMWCKDNIDPTSI